ncbi:MAG: hypothetical protein ILNGONEN_01631 [Syntrophorhabdaceae bacterium]|jgi:hypothetical protein|nr:hypothetical protein [Syntrophorhabdaceae bacterium]
MVGGLAEVRRQKTEGWKVGYTSKHPHIYTSKHLNIFKKGSSEKTD